MPVIHGPQRLRLSNNNSEWDAFDPDEIGYSTKTILFVLPGIVNSGVQAPLILFPSAGAVIRISALVGIPGGEIIVALERSTVSRIDADEVWDELSILTIPSNYKCVTQLVEGVALVADDCLRLRIQNETDAKNITVSIDIEVI